MLEIRTTLKILGLKPWNGVAFGRIQASSRKLAPLAGESRDVVIYVLEPGEKAVPPTLEPNTSKKGAYCRKCNVVFSGTTLTVCPDCGFPLKERMI